MAWYWWVAAVIGYLVAGGFVSFWSHQTARGYANIALIEWLLYEKPGWFLLVTFWFWPIFLTILLLGWCAALFFIMPFMIVEWFDDKFGS